MSWLALLCVLGTAGLDQEVRHRLLPIESESALSEPEAQRICRSIGKSRVVMLGELTHGDGTSHALKAALVKVLHRRLGFDVLIWESGLHDCAEMDALIGGDQPIEKVARVGVFGHWSQGREALEVFRFAREVRTSKRPLTMAGFDLQGSGSAFNSMFVDFAEWFKGVPEQPEEHRRSVEAAFELARTASRKPDPQKAFQEAEAAVLATADGFVKAFESNPEDMKRRWGDKWALRRRILGNAVEYAKMSALYRKQQAGQGTFFEPYNLRERVNAATLEWLIREHFRNRKVIVWAHNVHIYKGLPSRGAGVHQTPTMSEVDSMGRIVAKALGSTVYSLGFVAYSGQWSWLGGEPITFREVGSDSLEASLHRTWNKLGFLDLRDLPQSSPLKGAVATTIDQQNPLTTTTRISDGFDGLIFIDRVKPRVQEKSP